MELFKKIGQTAVWPEKHIDQTPFYVQLVPSMPFSLYFPVSVPPQSTLIPPFLSLWFLLKHPIISLAQCQHALPLHLVASTVPQGRDP